jgi:hypothetical protein
MSDPASMSVTTMVAVATIIIVLGVFTSVSISMFNNANNEMRAAWLQDELQPEVVAACQQDGSDHIGEYYPNVGDDDEYLKNAFPTETLVLNTRNPTSSDDVSTEWRLVFKEDDEVKISVPVANDTKCGSVDLTGETSGSGVKRFRVKILSNGAEIQVR